MDRPRFLQVVCALVTTTSVSGCALFDPHYCACPGTYDVSPAAYRIIQPNDVVLTAIHDLSCSPMELDAGCRTGMGVTGPLLPPEICG